MSLLAGAEAAVTDTAHSAAAIAQALADAPHDLEIRLAAYRFSFYTHDYPAAVAQAQWILSHAARQLNLPQDWRAVAPEDAEFTAHRFAPGLYLQALIGWGYCLARQHDAEGARPMLEQAARLDPTDRFGGAWMLRQLDAALEEG